jgi:hypothetical protein
MKLIPLIITFILLAVQPSSAVVMVGYGQSAELSCTTSDDSLIWHPVTQPGTDGSFASLVAQKITLSATTRFTAYKFRMNRAGSGGTYTLKLFNHDSGNNLPDETSVVSGTSTTANIDDLVGSGSSVVEVPLATPVTLAAGTYWLAKSDLAGTSAMFYVASTGDRLAYSADGGTNWNPIGNLAYDMELWGCQ